MQSASIKDEVYKIAEQLGEDATWDDVAYSISIRQQVACGVADIEAGRTVSHDELKKKWKSKLENKMD